MESPTPKLRLPRLLLWQQILLLVSLLTVSLTAFLLLAGQAHQTRHSCKTPSVVEACLSGEQAYGM
jgi:hypothetical protein